MNVNLNAIYVLWLREIKKFWRFKSRIIGSLATPLFFLIFLGFGIQTSIAGGESYLQFLVPGIIGMSLLFSSVFSGLTVIVDRQFGFLKEIMVAPVKRISIVFGRIFGGATISLIQGILIIIFTLFIGFKLSNPFSLIWAFLIMILISIIFIGLGLIFAARMKDTQGFQIIVNFVIFPIFFLSGALFPLENLPAVLQALTYADPLTYGVDALRYVLIGISSFHILIDLVALAAFAIVTIFFASLLFEKSEYS